MKLYTEEQVRYFFECGRNFQMNGEVTFSDALKELTPIELPSDEDIRKESMEFYDNNGADIYFIQGAKWVIEQIKQQDNEN